VVFWGCAGQWDKAAIFEEHRARVHDLHGRVANLIARIQ
jgi:hypothetical protein